MLEALTMCVDYSDYLEHTLPLAKVHFDKMVVVTVERDKDTQKVCEQHGVECVFTNRLYEDGAAFNKGKGLNDGFKALSRTDWIALFDCDIILQPDFRQKIDVELSTLNPECLYGTKRRKILYYEDYVAWKDGQEIKFYDRDPVICSGFFQLFNANCSKIKNKDAIYPEQVKSALGDITFRGNWKEEEWKRLQSIESVIHLPHQKHDLGKDVVCLRNWYGRKTLPFHMQTRNKKQKKPDTESIEDLFQ